MLTLKRVFPHRVLSSSRRLIGRVALTAVCLLPALPGNSYGVEPQTAGASAPTKATASASPKPDNASVWPEGLLLQSASIPADVTGVLKSTNERLLKDIRPAENAAVWLLQLLGPDAIAPDLRPAAFEMLGVRELSKTSPRVLFPEPFILNDPAAANADRDTLEGDLLQLQHEIGLGSNGPWNAEKMSTLKRYLEANRPALDLLVHASSLPQYYAPLLSEEEPPRLLSASYSLEKLLMFLSRLLTVRALEIRDDKSAASMSADFIALQRWAVLLANGSPFDVSGAKAHVIDAFACHATLTALAAGRFPKGTAATHLQELQKLTRLPLCARAADIGERAIVHQELEFLRSDNGSVEGFFELPEGQQRPADREVQLKDVRWNLASQAADAVFDEIVALLKNRNRAEQEAAFQKFDRAVEDFSQQDAEQTLEFNDALRKDAAAASRWIGKTMAYSLRPNLWQRRHTDDRATSRRDLVEVALALVAYRDEHGDYPADLDALAPQFLKTVPKDTYSGAPLAYRRFEDGTARVGTLGPNQQDDSGLNYNDDLFVSLPNGNPG